MLTYDVENFKCFSQNFYNECISKINFFDVPCTCGHKGTLTKHGYYKRNIKTFDGFITLNVLRVKCSSCGRTHAILLSSMVPFSQISLSDQLDVISGNDQKVIDNIPDIDESTYSRIKKNFRTLFNEFLIAENIPISNIKKVIYACLTKLKRQFLQMKKSIRLSSNQIILLENILIF